MGIRTTRLCIPKMPYYFLKTTDERKTFCVPDHLSEDAGTVEAVSIIFLSPSIFIRFILNFFNPSLGEQFVNQAVFTRNVAAH